MLCIQVSTLSVCEIQCWPLAFSPHLLSHVASSSTTELSLCHKMRSAPLCLTPAWIRCGSGTSGRCSWPGTQALQVARKYRKWVSWPIFVKKKKKKTIIWSYYSRRHAHIVLTCLLLTCVLLGAWLCSPASTSKPPWAPWGQAGRSPWTASGRWRPTASCLSPTSSPLSTLRPSAAWSWPATTTPSTTRRSGTAGSSRVRRTPLSPAPWYWSWRGPWMKSWRLRR